MWYRVFGMNDAQAAPAALLEHLHNLGAQVRGQFGGDDQGWFRAELTLPDASPPLRLERYLAAEEGLRTELNNWAAWLETAGDSPVHLRLMQHMIGTTQLFTLEAPAIQEESRPVEEVCLAVCRFLARETAGVYQVDEQGFFAADGTLLVREDPPE